MRWGILANLALILAVSGVLLFFVFIASMERAAMDTNLHQGDLVADLLQRQIRLADTPEKLWEQVRALCQGKGGLKVLLYDADARIVGGCGLDTNLEKPNVKEEGRRIWTTGPGLPSGDFGGRALVVDITGPFPHDVGVVRGLLGINPSFRSPAWEFFGAYLLLTQATLFFLGYLLFHRTIMGPVREIERLAEKAAGIADSPDHVASGRLKGDIQKISSRLRGIIIKILDDREQREHLIQQLRETNRDLEVAQEGLIRSEKLAGAGRLAAGLAHEVGNPLQVAMGYVELLRRESPADETVDILDRMDQELKRIHDTIQRLLEFARPIPKTVTACDINELTREASSLMAGRKGFRNIQFDYNLDPRLSPVETDPGKIRQVLVNLIFNAIDALSESGGTIILRTRKTEEDVEIAVEDTGCGIPEEDLKKVFDPFFTTKEPGKGTGLGLAVCLGLVESLGGSIDVQSHEGEGTVASIRLPVKPTAEKSSDVGGPRVDAP